MNTENETAAEVPVVSFEDYIKKIGKQDLKLEVGSKIIYRGQRAQ